MSLTFWRYLLMPIWKKPMWGQTPVQEWNTYKKFAYLQNKRKVLHSNWELCSQFIHSSRLLHTQSSSSGEWGTRCSCGHCSCKVAGSMESQRVAQTCVISEGFSPQFIVSETALHACLRFGEIKKELYVYLTRYATLCGSVFLEPELTANCSEWHT